MPSMNEELPAFGHTTVILHAKPAFRLKQCLTKVGPSIRTDEGFCELQQLWESEDGTVQDWQPIPFVS